MAEIRELQVLIKDWADKRFPNRTVQTCLLKLYEEIGELVKDPGSPQEHADIFIMLFDLAAMYDIDIADAVRAKMEVNKQRKWRLTESGTMQHVEEEPYQKLV